MSIAEYFAQQLGPNIEEPAAARFQYFYSLKLGKHIQIHELIFLVMSRFSFYSGLEDRA